MHLFVYFVRFENDIKAMQCKDMFKSTIASYIEFDERLFTKEELEQEIKLAVDCTRRATKGMIWL